MTSNPFKRIFHGCKNHLERLTDLEDVEHHYGQGLAWTERHVIRLSRCQVCGKIVAIKTKINPV